MTAAILAASLFFSFTTPVRQPCSPCGTDSCGPLRDIAAIRLYAATSLSRPKVFVRQKPARAPGVADTVRSPMNPKLYHWITCVDSTGNESCFSNPVRRLVPTATPIPLKLSLAGTLLAMVLAVVAR